jgi:hypothetical protein
MSTLVPPQNRFLLQNEPRQNSLPFTGHIGLMSSNFRDIQRWQSRLCFISAQMAQWRTEDGVNRYIQAAEKLVRAREVNLSS